MKKVPCNILNFYTYFYTFLLIIKTLLIAVSNYYYLIKHQAMHKHLLPFHVTNNRLK